MTSIVTAAFLANLGQVPGPVRRQASRAYALWRADPFHPSLQFRRVSQRQPVFSARVGIGHRALGLRDGDTVTWFWIGSHAEYDSLLGRI